MPLYFKKSSVKVKVNGYIKSRKKIGLVPTMGSLHEGHISLIKKAKQNNDVVWVSIFVNPTQFNSSKDLINYPKDLNKDLKLIKEISKDINVFSPEEGEMYNGKPKIKVYDFENLDKELEGKFRKNHFNGVATIVSKLLSLFKPNNVYFGEKDFQQILIIKRLVSIERINVKIVVCPTIREKNGLALSSRNNLLSKSYREKSSIIYKSLNILKENFKNLNLIDTQKQIIENINKKINFEVEYLEIVDENTLEIDVKINPKKTYRAFICVKANEVRLIDNILLN
tara:strand:- start:6567 stop:7415 length:849 start_codon:yes stop_codon:yes gene_type:complete